MGLAWQLFIFSMIAFACNFDYGYSSTFLNTPVEEFQQYLNESFRRSGRELTENAYNIVWNFICNIWFVGFFIGTWVSPLFNDRYGRKVGFIFGNGGNLIGAILRYCSVVLYQPPLLFAARFLTSATMAVSFQAHILYLQECSPTKRRGAFSSLSEVAFAVMCVITCILGTPEVLGKQLDYFLALTIPFCLIFFVFIFFIPETPKYLLLVRKDKEAAAKSVRYYQGTQVNVKKVLEEISLEAEEEGGEDSTMAVAKEIFRTPYLLKALILSCCALQLTVADWMLLLLSTYFLQHVHLSNSLAAWSSSLMTLAFMIGTFVGYFLVEWAGRRPLLLVFSILNNVVVAGYVVCAIFQPQLEWLKYGCLIALIGHGFTFGCGIGNVAWFLSAELVPQRYRSQIQAISYALNTVSVVLVTFSTLPLFQLIDVYSFLVLFTLPCVLSIAYLVVYLPETKGKEVHEIVAELRGEKAKIELEMRSQ